MMMLFFNKRLQLPRVKFNHEVKSQTGLSSLRLSYKRAQRKAG